MRTDKSKAFTKKWAFFCAGKYDKDRDFACKSRIIREEDFRSREFMRTRVSFCSMLDTNLSASRIVEGGEFTGNGWYRCNFSGIDYSRITMDMEQYEHCSLGNASFRQIQMLEVQAKDCNYAGTLWENAEFQECVFEKCNFRKARFINGRMDKTLFAECILDETVLDGITRSEVSFRNCMFRGWKEEWSKDCIFQNCTFENC